MEEFLSEEMALTKHQEKWVRDQVEAAARVPLPGASRQKWYDLHAGLVAVVVGVATIMGIVLAVAFAVVPHMEKDMRTDLGNDIGEQLRARGLDHLPEDLARIQGRLDGIQPLIEGLIKDQMHHVANLSQKDFGFQLPRIRQIVTAATKENVRVQVEDVKQIALKLRQTNEATPDFWMTAAAIINYQSFLNQMRGEAPDPVRISKPCVQRGTNITFDGQILGAMVFEECVVDLDSNSFKKVVFRNSVIKYRGGPAFLEDVLFVNCRFEIDTKLEATAPTQPNLISALLNTDDQKNITISTPN